MGPAVGDSRAHAERPQSETDRALRTAKALRYLIDWFIAGQVQQLRIVLRKPKTRRGTVEWAILISLFQSLRSIGGEGGCSAQLPNAAPAVASFPFGNQFEDFVDC